jgi:TRAP-type C4-dicarboxylate transport system permease large subunit
MGLSIAVAWWIVAKKEQITPPPKATARKSGSGAGIDVGDGAAVIVLVGLKFGVFTPTEAAVVAAVYALFVSTVDLSRAEAEGTRQCVRHGGQDDGDHHVPGRGRAGFRLADHGGRHSGQTIELLKPFMGNQTVLLIAIMVLVMIVGTAMDMTPTILIMTPVLMPVVKAAGIDPVYFGVLFIINNAIGLITPPVGTVLNVVAGVGKMKMDEVTRGVIPFMIAEFIVMFLMVFFPWLVTGPAKWFAG